MKREDSESRIAKRRAVYLERQEQAAAAERIRLQIAEAERLANALPFIADKTGREMAKPTLTHGLADKLRAKGIVK